MTRRLMPLLLLSACMLTGAAQAQQPAKQAVPLLDLPVASPSPAPASAPPAAPASPAAALPATPAVPAPGTQPAVPPAAAPAPVPAPVPPPAQEGMTLPPGSAPLASVPLPSGMMVQPFAVSRTLSVMFTRKDMETLVIPGLDLYASLVAEDQAKAATQQEDLAALLQSLQIPAAIAAVTEQQQEPVSQRLPNLYLGSIVYYSQRDWAIWINGRKLSYAFNKPENVLFVKNISAESVTLTWRIPEAAKTDPTWQEMLRRKDKPGAGVAFDAGARLVTLRLHPNQSFVTPTLSLAEGLVKGSPPATAEAQAAPAAPAGAMPPAPPPPPPAPLRRTAPPRQGEAPSAINNP